MTPTPRITVVGAGGAVGSHVVRLVARLSGIEHVTLIDPDVYEARNLAGQDIRPTDLGRRKVDVQARRFSARSPGTRVVPIADPVEDVAPGRLRGDVLLACVDSRRARQTINERALSLGMPWIDAGLGVLPDRSMIARIAIYAPGPGQPCLECAWGASDYALLEQAYPCAGGTLAVAPSNAPANLAALTAALMVIECEALLSGAPDRAGRQILVDALHHAWQETRFRRQLCCRIPEHAPWHVNRVLGSPHTTLVSELLDMAVMELEGASPLTMSVEGRRWFLALLCPECGRSVSRLGTTQRANGAWGSCHECRVPLIVAGFDTRDRLDVGEISAQVLAADLTTIGLRGGDVVRFEAASARCRFELSGDQDAR